MSRKITWDMIYKDFRSRHPRLRKTVTGYYPYNFLKIEIRFADQAVMIYDYMEHKGTWLVPPR